MACGAVTSPPKSARANQRHHSGDTWASPLKNTHTHTHTQHNGKKKKKRKKKKPSPKVKVTQVHFLKEGGEAKARAEDRWRAAAAEPGGAVHGADGAPGAEGARREDLPGQVERHAPRAAAAAIRGADAARCAPIPRLVERLGPAAIRGADPAALGHRSPGGSVHFGFFFF